MMKSRHQAREVALQILYKYDLATHSVGQNAPQGYDLTRSLKHHFEHFGVHESIRGFIGQLVAGTLERVKDLDPLVERYASNWKVSRMSSVDRSLLRMAVYEMIHLKDTPASVVIDEAIELAKEFGTSDTPAFINGVLDSIKNDHLKSS